MKELILDGFFRCGGCGRRYHLMDTLETDAYCDECAQTLQPEIDEDQEETDDEDPDIRCGSNPVLERFPRDGVKYPENKLKIGQNGPITSP